MGATGPPSAATTVHCLGAFVLTINGTTVRRWQAGKARALFQYLLLNRDRAVARETLVSTLWPGAARAAVSLNVAAHALRQILSGAQPGQPGDASGGSGLALRSHDSGYTLRTGNVWIDFEEFAHEVEVAGKLQLAGHELRALDRYRQAVALYRGDLLPGEAAGWAEDKRQTLRDLALRALHALVEAALRTDDVIAVIRWCQQALEIDGCSEETYRLLMYCHARLGQMGRVMSWYRLCVRKLHDELGVRPQPVTTQLLQRALDGQLVRAQPSSRRRASMIPKAPASRITRSTV